ncbi:hypothetical protein KYB31_05585 [Clostridium felsineum]|uniref:hypothetical protein n=1 Tax=Clostridium felsineum TaxID=36839 RepID=UPI00214DEFEB|nr:hypothetical protein [Clostridium felsineum]MCR3758467.1 hypothetical protein [Clostridium felsineum]
MFESIYIKDNWKKWNDNSSESDPPPDFYSDEFEMMMEVMRVDDHSFKKKGNLINPTYAKESKVCREIENSGILDCLPNEAALLFNVDTKLPTDKDHNYKFYTNSFARIVKKHSEHIEMYRNNHKNYRLIFFIFDESSAYFEVPNKETMKINRNVGTTIQGKAHFYFLDSTLLENILKYDIDYVIWYAPFKLVNTNNGVFDLPKAVIYDVKHFNLKPIIYKDDQMMSTEL